MKNYLDLLEDVLHNGAEIEDRTGVKTLQVFHRTLRVNLTRGFPLLTTKEVSFRNIIYELIWFISGNENAYYLSKHHVNFWNPWLNEQGYLPYGYGVQWRRWDNKIDQLAQVIYNLRTNPYSRRHIVSSWNASNIDKCPLPPCHYSFQFVVTKDKFTGNDTLNCIFNMRSADTFIGLPYNLASYSLLTHIIAEIVGMQVGELVFNGADVHLYTNHVRQAKEQVTRTPKPLPILVIEKPITCLEDFTPDSVSLKGYDPHPAIKAEVAV